MSIQYQPLSIQSGSIKLVTVLFMMDVLIKSKYVQGQFVVCLRFR